MLDDDRPIIGVDVMSVGGRLSDFSYSIAVLRGTTLTSYEHVSLSRLIRILWELRPDIIAIDNIMELGGNKENLIKILELLPPESKIVQVTLINGELIDLRKLVRELGISLEQGKLSPRRTAELLALLAAKGYGTELRVFEDKVKVLVGRSRVPGSGGSSSDRFKRGLRTSVLRVVKEIKEELDREGIDYDVFIRRSKGGIEGALFTIYASRDKVYRIIKPFKKLNVVIKVKPVVHKKALSIFYGENTPERYLIIGVDPGIETGVAVVDLDLNPLKITSSRNLDRDEIIQLILRYGTPVVVSTDKNPPPETVIKLAASLNVKLYVPSKSMSTSEKDALVNDYISIHKVDIKNTHERDALASCIKVYKEFEDKLRQLESKLHEIGLSTVKMQKYKAKVIKGFSVADIIEEVINDYIVKGDLEERHEELIKVIKSLVSEELDKKDRKFVNEIEKVIRERDLLIKRVNELEKQLHDLEGQLHLRSIELNAELAKEREIAELKHRLETVTNYVNKLEMQISESLRALDNFRSYFNYLFTGEYILARKLQKLSMEELVKSSNSLGNIKSREVVLINDVPETVDESVRRALLNLNLRVVTPKELGDDVIMKYFRELNTVIYTCKDYIELNDDLVLLNKHILMNLEGLEDRLKEKERHLNEVNYDKLLNIINEYRSLRNQNITFN